MCGLFKSRDYEFFSVRACIPGKLSQITQACGKPADGTASDDYDSNGGAYLEGQLGGGRPSDGPLRGRERADSSLVAGA